GSTSLLLGSAHARECAAQRGVSPSVPRPIARVNHFVGMTTSAQASLLRSSHQARAAYRQRRSLNANSLCSQKSAGSRESDRLFKRIFYDDVSEFESYMPSQAVRPGGLLIPAISRDTAAILASHAGRSATPPASPHSLPPR